MIVSEEMLDQGKLHIATGFTALLRAQGLDTFKNIMERKGGETVRSVPGRSTVKIELQWPDGAKQIAFLKRYEPEYLSNVGRLLRFIHWPGAGDEATREWRMLHALKAGGFQVAQPVASGRESSLGIITRSFVMATEARGTPADRYLKTCPISERQLLAVSVANLARRFHTAGFVHRDFYLAHVFVSSHESEFDLVLLDLQRVGRPVLFRERLRVKDLGSLAYSALKAGASMALLMRGFKTYLAVGELRNGDKKLFRRIQRRVRWLTRRWPKHDHRFVQLGADRDTKTRLRDK